jgi:hypothetical protein
MMKVVYISSTTCRLITFVLNVDFTVLFQSEDNKDENLNRQGSFRKLVPGSSNGDSPLSMSVKMIDRPIVPQTNKQHAVFLQEYNILSE